MTVAEFLRRIGRYSSFANTASDVVLSAAVSDVFSPDSHLQRCLQSGCVPTGLSCFVAVSAALPVAEFSYHPALLYVLRSASPPCSLPCVNHRRSALQLALITPVQPVISLSLSLQFVSDSRSVSGDSVLCAAHRCNYHTRSLIGNCGVTFVARQIPKKTICLRVFRICLDSFGFVWKLI